MTLLSLNLLPILNSTFAESISLLSLGLATSTTVVPPLSTSYPLTYALPGDNLTHIKSSVGLLP